MRRVDVRVGVDGGVDDDVVNVADDNVDVVADGDVPEIYNLMVIGPRNPPTACRSSTTGSHEFPFLAFKWV